MKRARVLVIAAMTIIIGGCSSNYYDVEPVHRDGVPVDIDTVEPERASEVECFTVEFVELGFWTSESSPLDTLYCRVEG